MIWRLGQHLILGRGLQCELLIDRLSSCGRIDTKTENTDGYKRFSALTSITRCRGITGLDGDEHMEERRLRTGTVHMMQLDGTLGRADTNGLAQIDWDQGDDWDRT